MAVGYGPGAVGNDQPTGDIWTSTDAGLTWTNRTQGSEASGQIWAAVASDASGMHLVAVTFAGTGCCEAVWSSPYAGATWSSGMTATSTANLAVGPAVASDSTGAHLVAITVYSDIWTSSDSGVTWVNRTVGTAASLQSWMAVASDSSGAHLVAASSHESENDIWVSGDGGATWSNVTSGTAASGQTWVAVASDTAGAHLVAVSDNVPGGPVIGGDIWTS